MTTQTMPQRSQTNLPRIPAADVLEGPAEIRIILDIPGVALNEVDVVVEADELRLRTTGDVHFHRTFRVPDIVDADQVQATLKDGVLTLSLAKVPAAQARKLSVVAG